MQYSAYACECVSLTSVGVSAQTGCGYGGRISWNDLEPEGRALWNVNVVRVRHVRMYTL